MKMAAEMVFLRVNFYSSDRNVARPIHKWFLLVGCGGRPPSFFKGRYGALKHHVVTARFNLWIDYVCMSARVV